MTVQKYPMMNRRQALAAIGIAMIGDVESPGNSTVPATQLPSTADNRLNADLTSIGSRVYSEEGVPMFLACENVYQVGTSPKEEPSPSALSPKVASAFRRYVDEWEHMRPDAPASDVAKLLEFIADRDFAAGGVEASL